MEKRKSYESVLWWATSRRRESVLVLRVKGHRCAPACEMPPVWLPCRKRCWKEWDHSWAETNLQGFYVQSCRVFMSPVWATIVSVLEKKEKKNSLVKKSYNSLALVWFTWLECWCNFKVCPVKHTLFTGWAHRMCKILAHLGFSNVSLKKTPRNHISKAFRCC